VAVDADLIGRMLVQLQLGTAKADFPGPPLTGEASALWDQLAAEVAAIKAAGGAVEPSTPEPPDLPEVKRPPEEEAGPVAG
jgi:hypothetical protein